MSYDTTYKKQRVDIDDEESLSVNTLYYNLIVTISFRILFCQLNLRNIAKLLKQDCQT